VNKIAQLVKTRRGNQWKWLRKWWSGR